nr:MAG: hypothetical protein [Microvirus sp.]
MAYNAKGEEILDPTPVAVPIHFKAPQPLNDRIREMVRREASLYAMENGQETFEEADDFNCEDDTPDPSSPWEEDFDPQAPFICAREAEIRHGQVSDFSEEKIHRGRSELDRLNSNSYHKKSINKKPSSKTKPAASAADNRQSEDESSDETEQ